MTENYLDVTKSVIISSPAGSGKTEKLARRYIGLLDGGAEVEKILCITFTEKAAAEMKARILGILRQEKPELMEKIREKIPLMRISTIHAFCLKVLKRFALELGLDPALRVMDELASRNLWTEALHESLMDEEAKPGGLSRMIRQRGLKGWSGLKRLLDGLNRKSPYPELLMREGQVPGEAVRELLEVYGVCLRKYRDKKQEKGLLDYNDLEMLAHDALSLGPEAHNILYSFDEHTDHLLVDEFQDTSTLQWKIIDRLTEEWRSGMGAKREAGKKPTIFLVGDEKQSIYLFRGANVSLFQEAKERFAEWLGEEYVFVEPRDNYRSLPAIVNFTNRLFEKIMPEVLFEPWKTRYSPFEAAREGKGRVDLVLLESRESAKETRIEEAGALARMISSLHGRHEIQDREGKRPCTFGDMAVLLRRRTHLGLFEYALRKEGVPLIVLKGIGFYEEPEVAVLREFVSFLVDPSDDYSLFCLLRSPLFGLDYRSLTRLASGKAPIIEKLAKSKIKRLHEISLLLEGWISQSSSTPLAFLLEKVLLETGAWERFRERQRLANIKKFIFMVEGFERDGLSPVEIREKLLRRRYALDEAKANINAEGMDAVKIMTVHAAKGLEFPMVFLPSLEERHVIRSGPVVMDDTGGKLSIALEEDHARRNRHEWFRRQRLKEEEEEKRLFYVAATRARDYLCMISSPGEKNPNCRHAYLEEAFELENPASLPFTVIREKDLQGMPVSHPPIISEKEGDFLKLPAYVEPIAHEPRRVWREVTEEGTAEARISHGEDWVLAGTVMHRLFEELSKGIIAVNDIENRALHLIRAEAPGREAVLRPIMADMKKLMESGIMEDIVLPRENAHAELPFVLERGKYIYSGRIDRLIIRDGTAHVYDYKTFPVREKEIPELIEKYRRQMDAYATAAERLFELRARAYLVFTHLARVLETGRGGHQGKQEV